MGRNCESAVQGPELGFWTGSCTRFANWPYSQTKLVWKRGGGSPPPDHRGPKIAKPLKKLQASNPWRSSLGGMCRLDLVGLSYVYPNKVAPGKCCGGGRGGVGSRVHSADHGQNRHIKLMEPLPRMLPDMTCKLHADWTCRDWVADPQAKCS